MASVIIVKGSVLVRPASQSRVSFAISCGGAGDATVARTGSVRPSVDCDD